MENSKYDRGCVNWFLAVRRNMLRVGNAAVVVVVVVVVIIIIIIDSRLYSYCIYC